MLRKIPLHSLVLIISTSRLQEEEFLDRFEPYEVISKKTISNNIYGGSNRYYNSELVNSEYIKTLNLKLSIGERVVIFENNFNKNKRQFLHNIAARYDVPVYYIVYHGTIHDKGRYDEFSLNEEQIVSGDGAATVIDARIDDFIVIKKFPYADLFKDVKKRGFSGITVAGDIHGNLEALRSSLDWSLARNTLYIQLGDLVDYGRHSLECVELLYDRIIRGYAINVIGNHDRKLEKWFSQENNIRKKPDYLKYNSEIKLSDSNQQTVNKIKSLTLEQRKIFETKFNTIMNLGRYHYNIGNCSFSHAGYHQDMVNIYSDRLYGRLESIALYGNDPSTEEDYKIYTPQNMNIFVGHMIKNNIIPKKEYINNSVIVYQDTGSGKGGNLTTTDLIFKNNKLEIQSHNRW